MSRPTIERTENDAYAKHYRVREDAELDVELLEDRGFIAEVLTIEVEHYPTTFMIRLSEPSSDGSSYLTTYLKYGIGCRS